MSKKKPSNEAVVPDQIQHQEFSEIMDQSFTRYAFKVIEDRAIPDARDGCKPSQRPHPLCNGSAWSCAEQEAHEVR